MSYHVLFIIVSISCVHKKKFNVNMNCQKNYCQELVKVLLEPCFLFFYLNISPKTLKSFDKISRLAKDYPESTDVLYNLHVKLDDFLRYIYR